MSHTPAPWAWWTSNSWKRLKHDSIWLTKNVLDPFVARDGHPDISISEDDMRLIAAAPDLLAALQGLVERGTDSPEHLAAEAAIAKATGKA